MAKLVIKDSVTIRKKVYHYIREKILKGEISPKERLIETRLAQEIGTSRTPVREALHSLELEKLIKSIPRVGYIVESMDQEDLEQICEIRSVIETLGARWAIQKARKRLAKDLARSVARQEQALAVNDSGGYVELDAQFHEIIARLSGSDRLLELVQTLRRHMLRYRMHVVYAMDTALRSIEGHKEILRAVQEGDSDTVVEALQQHLRQAKEDILQYVLGDNPIR
ncbi:GntR family transcriptional regulator [Syntrophorhabdus aromaticivorans]|uniref:GntR family transcriptional regulator n=1 Tax=Syntrophorhabdus aromaticivorans TaxID=328301 RepID=A0A351TZC4_9BACT|nr:GntR family transcriptional regulator [Syntrophorhabdus aromaticivorans]NLW36023.1 GntR family transcriptional regulator [Syntrophorhabdus aromaticivorans]HBA53055.1 GntR family transcriptional regulator [Syntrophorhabdus aromaticivorans]